MSKQVHDQRTFHNCSEAEVLNALFHRNTKWEVWKSVL